MPSATDVQIGPAPARFASFQLVKIYTQGAYTAAARS
jgi:hypothetical protein